MEGFIGEPRVLNGGIEHGEVLAHLHFFTARILRDHLDQVAANLP